MATRRPSFNSAWSAFTAVNMSVKQVGQKIGGQVKVNTEMTTGGFENACPIRMSYVLNATGFPIPRNRAYATVSGADNRQYMYRVNDMMAYLERTFGKPDLTVKSPKPSDFANMKGIVVVRGHGWSNARGHVTLWNGTSCSDTCHFLYDPENGTFTPDTAAIWKLQ
ncbi:Uncharacterised protein [Bordetella ansorpii]|uniref:Cytoplasmic protein n=2 Tax=Bordetella ansorpii TaxID=288768 RepID=A0A157SK83_9BORD|nr:Uncharacterised protein [Bordetella ansorpii]